MPGRRRGASSRRRARALRATSGPPRPGRTAIAAAAAEQCPGQGQERRRPPAAPGGPQSAAAAAAANSARTTSRSPNERPRFESRTTGTVALPSVHGLCANSRRRDEDIDLDRDQCHCDAHAERESPPSAGRAATAADARAITARIVRQLRPAGTADEHEPARGDQLGRRGATRRATGSRTGGGAGVGPHGAGNAPRTGWASARRPASRRGTTPRGAPTGTAIVSGSDGSAAGDAVVSAARARP